MASGGCEAFGAVFRPIRVGSADAHQLERCPPIKRLRQLDEMLGSRGPAIHQEERLTLQRERDKLDRSRRGIKDMGGLPDMIFVIDTTRKDHRDRRSAAAQHSGCRRSSIPIRPQGSPMWCGHDDAGRAISLYCDLIARAAIDGISRAQAIRDRHRRIGAAGREEVPVAPQAAGFQGLAGPRGTADDLKKLTACRARSRRKLNDLGIFHYWQLAELITTPRTRSATASAADRADAWVAQAKTLTAEAE